MNSLKFRCLLNKLNQFKSLWSNRKMRTLPRSGSISWKQSKHGSLNLWGGTCIPSWQYAACSGPFSLSNIWVGAQVSWGRDEPRCKTTWVSAELQHWREPRNYRWFFRSASFQVSFPSSVNISVNSASCLIKLVEDEGRRREYCISENCYVVANSHLIMS